MLPMTARSVTVTGLSLLALPTLVWSASDNHVSSSSYSALSPGVGFRAEASIMGESALIDKETGRVFWEGGASSTLFESIEPVIKSALFGLDHIKATALTGLLLLAVIGHLSTEVKQKLLQLTITEIPGCRISLNAIYQFFVHAILFVPRFDNWFFIFIYAIYLFEAYNSSTRQYVSNILTGPQELESYIEKLRTANPTIEWKVRCFHYEFRSWIDPFYKVISVIRSKLNSTKSFIVESQQKQQSLLTKKSISKFSQGFFNFEQCTDKTIAAVWKRAKCIRYGVFARPSQAEVTLPDEDQASINKATVSITSTAPFTKIMLSKTIVLEDSEARKDYFEQQSKFVADHGHFDDYAEFSTNIEVAGFHPRIMALRSSNVHPLLKFLCSAQCFWLCTLFGLTVPYRILLSSYCDVLRLIIVKETSVKKETNKKKKIASFEVNTEKFRSIMQKLMLYSNTTERRQTLADSGEKNATTISSKNATAVLLKEGLEAASIMTDIASENQSSDNRTADEPPSTQQ